MLRPLGPCTFKEDITCDEFHFREHFCIQSIKVNFAAAIEEWGWSLTLIHLTVLFMENTSCFLFFQA